MNKRIVRLIDQMDQSGIPYQAGDNLMTITDRYLEKFAELIVREMLDIFDKRAEPGTGFYEPQEPAEMIRQHFGVE